MNDAVAITLFRSTGKFVGISIGAEEGIIAFIDFVISFVGSLLIGYFLGLFSAWIFKVVDMSHHRIVLVSVFVGMVYVPFFLAGAFSVRNMSLCTLPVLLCIPPHRDTTTEWHRDNIIHRHHGPPIQLQQHAPSGQASRRLRLRDHGIHVRDLGLPLHGYGCLLFGECLSPSALPV